MKIIDFERKGNMVRFYLGEKTDDWGWTRPDYKCNGGRDLETPNWLRPSDTYYGDDWDDAPYEHNAGKVYDEFVKGHKDISFDFDGVVVEPCSGEFNCRWCKYDMEDRKVLCIVIVPKEVLNKFHLEYWRIDKFSDALSIDGIKKFYFGDDLDE